MCVLVFFHHNKNVSCYCSPSLPALDWQLPSCSGPYNLQIEVQPKSHHRAHYETEGSRGAVKALSGGHPVVQVRHELYFSQHMVCKVTVNTAVYWRQGELCVFKMCIKCIGDSRHLLSKLVTCPCGC